MTTQENELLLEVAKRMPGVLVVAREGGVFWADTVEMVTTRELLSVAAEFEKTMTESEHETYREILWQIVEESGHPISASFVQRAQAWLKVKA